MSKGSFLLHGTRGKVGNLVARRHRGNTVLAEYTIPKNPQTQKQMAQRIIFATVGQAAKFLKPIIDHSFEGKAVGAESVDYFRKRNLSVLRAGAAIDFEETTKPADSHVFMSTKGVSALIPNRYQIAGGSLTVPSAAECKVATGSSRNQLLLFPQTNSITTDAQKKITLGALLGGLLGFTQEGQQITKCFIYGVTGQYLYSFNGDNAPGFQIAQAGFSAVRLCLKQSISFDTIVDLSSEDVGVAFNAALSSALDLTKSDAAFVQYVKDSIDIDDVDSGAIKLTMTAQPNIDQIIGNGKHVLAFGTILSQPYADGWLRSNSYMQLLDIPKDGYNYGLYWNSAIQAWFAGQEIADNELFLEQGGEQNEVGY